jgi:hypothetical protein
MGELTHPDDLAADAVQYQRVVAGEIDGFCLDERGRRETAIRSVIDPFFQ